MSAATWDVISIVGFACCAAFAVICLVLFFYDRIPAVVRFLSGRAASVGVRHVWEDGNSKIAENTGRIAFFRNRSGSKSLAGAGFSRGRDTDDLETTEKLKRQSGRMQARGEDTAILVENGAGTDGSGLTQALDIAAVGSGQIQTQDAGAADASCRMQVQGDIAADGSAQWQMGRVGETGETTILAEEPRVNASGIRVIRSETVVHAEWDKT